MLPAFVAAVTERRDHLHDLLKAATEAEPDRQLTVGSKRYRRLFTIGDARHAEFQDGRTFPCSRSPLGGP